MSCLPFQDRGASTLFESSTKSQAIKASASRITREEYGVHSKMKPRRWLPILLCLGVWQVCAIAMIFFYGRFLVHRVSAAYVSCFGNIQANYVAYERTMTYFCNFVITAPATVGAILLLDRLQQRQSPAKVRMLGFLGWQWIVWSALVGAYEYGISYKINQLDWAIFGPPADLYSFRNLVLHRIVTWFLCTISMGMVALWVYVRMTTPKPAGFPILSVETTSTASGRAGLR